METPQDRPEKGIPQDTSTQPSDTGAQLPVLGDPGARSQPGAPGTTNEPVGEATAPQHPTEPPHAHGETVNQTAGAQPASEATAPLQRPAEPRVLSDTVKQTTPPMADAGCTFAFDTSTLACAPTSGDWVKEGEYYLKRQLDKGGQGSVFVARQRSLERDVALKWFPKPDEEDTICSARQRLEAMSLAKLTSPYIVKVVDAFWDQQYGYCIVTELVSGESLRARMKRALSSQEVVGIAKDIAKALRDLSAVGLCHRDLKPKNVMIPATGDINALVLDLGTVLNIDAGGLGTVGFLGTSKYTAPEQLLLKPKIDGRADLYALGLMLYEMLGGYPFTGARNAGNANDPVPPIRAKCPDVPTGLALLVEKLTAVDASERPQTAVEVVAALEEIAKQL